MEKRVLAVCMVAGFLGILSVILAIVAESKRIKPEDITIENLKCIYPERPALGLGISSAIILLVDQILISAFAGCICCKNSKPTGSKFCIAVTCYVISWVTFVLALRTLLVGAIFNSSYTLNTVNADGCLVIRPGIFAAGAVLCFLTVGLGIISYILGSARPSDSAVFNQGIVMGQPHINGAPVFVHEDTYHRQQCP